MEEKYKLEETMHITQCDNGILMEVTTDNDGYEDVFRVYSDEEKNKGVGNLLLEDVEHVMDNNACNKVKVSITIEPLED